MVCISEKWFNFLGYSKMQTVWNLVRTQAIWPKATERVKQATYFQVIKDLKNSPCTSIIQVFYYKVETLHTMSYSAFKGGLRILNTMVKRKYIALRKRFFPEISLCSTFYSWACWQSSRIMAALFCQNVVWMPFVIMFSKAADGEQIMLLYLHIKQHFIKKKKNLFNLGSLMQAELL